MGLLTIALNVTLDGCCDHHEVVANDEILRYWARVMDGAGAMLFISAPTRRPMGVKEMM